ncbi:MAG: hypothetical protein HQK53_04740 [Oligoflexia bacterium]|nr:hypothetical protein [Oligoflexia bacterium]
MGAVDFLVQNNLSYELTPIHLRELIFLSTLPCDIYGFIENIFHIVMHKEQLINRDSLRKVVDLGLAQLFVRIEDYQNLVKDNQAKLLKITRSLSLGDLLVNGKKQVYYLSLNLDYLHKNPIDDETLLLQYQCLIGLGKLLQDKTALIPSLYQYLAGQSYHYTIAQPLLSSLMLLGFLKSVQQFSEKEITSLFVASYFKDIGMALIPKDALNRSDLSVHEKDLISRHQDFSGEILDGRIPLNPNYFNIIRNHHHHSLLVPNNLEINKVLTGTETLFIESTDVITAITNRRPYREKLPLFSGLKLVKNFMGEEHYQEFKMLVWFLQKFFKFGGSMPE